MTTERIILIEKNLEENQGTHKCYVDNPKQYSVFEFGDYVILKFAYWVKLRYLEVENLLRKGKLSPRFVGLFEILERVGTLAYKVALPPSLFKIHNVFMFRP